jgi:predicted esterase
MRKGARMLSKRLPAALAAAAFMLAASPCGALAGEDPGAFLDTDYDSIYRQAHEAYTDGEYRESARLYLEFLRGNTSDAGAMYNLACCYGLLGDEVLATEFMVRSVRAGFDDLEWISWDPDFDSVRDGGLFPAALDSIGQAMDEREAMLGGAGYMAAGTILEYRIMFPEDYDPDRAVPLVIGLHGYGASPEGFAGLWDRFDEPDFIFAVPRAPYNRFSGPDPGYSWAIRGDDEELSRESVRISEDWICSLRNALVGEYRISDVYLMGFSQGCSFTYGIGLRHPDLFDGLICFAGWLDTTWVSGDQVLAASHMPVVIAHGFEDQVVEYEASTTARDYLEESGYDVLFIEFEGGHTVDADALVEAQSWLVDGR